MEDFEKKFLYGVLILAKVVWDLAMTICVLALFARCYWAWHGSHHSDRRNGSYLWLASLPDDSFTYFSKTPLPEDASHAFDAYKLPEAPKPAAEPADTVASDTIEDPIESSSAYLFYEGSVKGHIERDSIWGNFTGHGIDTLYISDIWMKNLPPKQVKRLKKRLVFNEDLIEYCQIVKSTNPKLPDMVVFSPGGLVLEGDVDGDGKDEWGYMYSWTSSQWRTYRIYNYDSRRKKWRYLYYGGENELGEKLLSTPEYLRSSGKEVVEKGPRRGWIKINYCHFGSEIYLKDTVVRATYTPITEENW